uniref:trans-2,3-enoyl-CoA reductase b n=1 Tax=Oncorhynchus gorbuscha TaxID=8017 RepID=UPI001EAE8655|nr:trans-2,3-enoyl-CoA reductase b [Oncorhynchus gorbuscha]
MDTVVLEGATHKKAGPGVSQGCQHPLLNGPKLRRLRKLWAFEVEILDAKTKDKLCFLDKILNVHYYINHPLYTPPTIYGEQQVRIALIIFLFCQVGNFSIHIALRNLRPPGSKTRKIPYPTKNPFTWIFLLVSCPNYTYELGSWFGFTLMTQCLPVAFFTAVGFIQMTVWAKGKHRSYLKEFRDYPPLRSPILPFVL